MKQRRRTAKKQKRQKMAVEFLSRRHGYEIKMCLFSRFLHVTHCVVRTYDRRKRRKSKKVLPDSRKNEAARRTGAVFILLCGGAAGVIKEGAIIRARIGRGAGADYAVEVIYKAFKNGSSVRVYDEEATTWLKVEEADVGLIVQKVFAISFEGEIEEVDEGGTFKGVVVPSEEFDALEGVEGFAVSQRVLNGYVLKTTGGVEI